jgi:hypothetical protein
MNIAHAPIIPALQEASQIPEQPVQSVKQVGIAKRVVLRTLDDLKKPGALGPKSPKLKATTTGKGGICLQKER